MTIYGIPLVIFVDNVLGFTLAIGAIAYSLIPGKERGCEAAASAPKR